MTQDNVPTLSGGRVTGQLTEVRRDLLGMLARFNEECGDIGRMHFFGLPLLVVNSPELVEELLVRKASSFRKSRVMKAALDPLIGTGLFTSDGALWKRQRKLMAPLFHQGQLGRYAAIMQGAAARSASRWRDGETLDLAHEMTRVTMNIAGETLFGIEVSDEADELGEALTVALEWSAEAAASVPLGLQTMLGGALEGWAKHLPDALSGPTTTAAAALEHPLLAPTPKNRALKQAIEVLDRRVAKMIAERRERGGAEDDLLSRLLAARDDESGEGMTDKQLRDEIMTLFVAGHETTAAALAWTFYLLSRHPSVAEAVRRDVDALGGKVLDAGDLPRLDLLTRVFKETLRLYPPVPIYERYAAEDVTIGQAKVAKGDYVATFPWALHHRESLWPDANAFDPERFTKEAEAARPRHTWIPFGAGPRVCIGNNFALMEGPLVLATVLQHASIEIVESHVDVDPKAATLRPLGGLRATIRKLAPGRA